MLVKMGKCSGPCSPTWGAGGDGPSGPGTLWVGASCSSHPTTCKIRSCTTQLSKRSQLRPACDTTVVTSRCLPALQSPSVSSGWSGSGGLGAKEQGIQDPIKGGDVRDKWDQYKGVGVALDDPYENYRRNKSYSFIARMKARDECK